MRAGRPSRRPASQRPVNRKRKDLGEEEEVASGGEGMQRPGKQEWRVNKKVLDGETNGNAGCGERNRERCEHIRGSKVES